MKNNTDIKIGSYVRWTDYSSATMNSKIGKIVGVWSGILALEGDSQLDYGWKVKFSDGVVKNAYIYEIKYIPKNEALAEQVVES